MKKWIVGKPDRDLAKHLAEECNTDPFVALISVARGIRDAAELEQLLSDECCISDPRELADVTLAADIINAAIENKDKIAVYGDYDCDGIASTALMYDYLTSRGADVITYIPDRLSEGYGMNIPAVDKLNKAGVKLIVTVDNGISSQKEVEYADSLGIATVITDHHIPPAVLPAAAAIVDPKRADCGSSFKEICGAEVAFKLCCVLDDKEPEQMLPRYADLLCIAVIGDVMPLVFENRSVVREGINKIKRNPSVGISAILNAAGVDRKAITSSKISFAVTPRINAAGRMGSAVRALDLLLCKDMLKALGTAGEIDSDNARRQSVEREISAQATGIIDENGYYNDRVIVVEGDRWHMGVTGIVASRICERYGKPAIVLSREGDTVHGSGRSYDGFNLFEAISACGEYLTRYGGHSQAAGVTLDHSDVDAFRRAINAYASAKAYTAPVLNIDFKLNPAAMSVDMAHAIKQLEPFGHGNHVPVFALTGVKLERISELSAGKHLKLGFSKENTRFDALLFNTSRNNFCYLPGDMLDLAVTLEANYFRDEYHLSVLIKDIRAAGIDDDALFYEKEQFENFLRGEAGDTSLLPSREQVAVIYREIKQGAVQLRRINNIHLNDIGYAKTRVIIKMLEELGLVCENEGSLFCTDNVQRTDLTSAPIYKAIAERGMYHP